MARLFILSGDHIGQTHDLTGSCNLGRGKEADVVIGGKSVSRLHARLEEDPGGRWVLSDLGSSNGTRVEGQRLNGPCALMDGETFKLGDVELRLRLDGPVDPEPEPAPTSAPAPPPVPPPAPSEPPPDPTETIDKEDTVEVPPVEPTEEVEVEADPQDEGDDGETDGGEGEGDGGEGDGGEGDGGEGDGDEGDGDGKQEEAKAA